MSIVSELMQTPGVVAAGEFTFKGELVRYEGDLVEKDARVVGNLCYQNTLSANMQYSMFCDLDQHCKVDRVPGWLVRGNNFTVCVVGQFFCFVRNSSGALNIAMSKMRDRYAHQEKDPLVMLYEKIGGNTDEQLL